MSDVLLWLGRIIAVFPALKELWEAATASTAQPDRELAAALELVRSIKTAQAKEEIDGA